MINLYTNSKELKFFLKNAGEVEHISNLNAIVNEVIFIHISTIEKDFIDNVIKCCHQNKVILIVDEEVSQFLFGVIETNYISLILTREFLKAQLDAVYLAEIINKDFIFISKYFRRILGLSYIQSKLDLTKRQLEVIEQISLGLTNDEIATKLYLTVGTVRNYISDIFEKAGVKNRTQLAAKYYSLFYDSKKDFISKD